MTEKAKAIMDAHYYGIVPMLKELINQLQQPSTTIAPTVISCVDILELCNELEKFE